MGTQAWRTAGTFMSEGGAPAIIASRRAFDRWRGESGTLDRPEHALVVARGSMWPATLPQGLGGVPASGRWGGWGEYATEAASIDEARSIVAAVEVSMREAHPGVSVTGPRPSQSAVEMLDRHRGTRAAAAITRARTAPPLREERVFALAGNELVLELLHANDFRRALARWIRMGDDDGEGRSTITHTFADEPVLLWTIGGIGTVTIARREDGNGVMLVKVQYTTSLDDDPDGERAEQMAVDYAIDNATEGEVEGTIALADDIVMAYSAVSASERDRALATSIQAGTYRIITSDVDDDGFGVRWCALLREP